VTDPTEARRTLGRLARGAEPDWRDRIDRASDAIDDVTNAAAFVEEVGLSALETAVERAAGAGDSDRERRGREALEAFETFRERAAADHFHPGHDTDLRRPGIGTDE
jgi:hypothetical protein